MVVLGGWAVSYGRGNPVTVWSVGVFSSEDAGHVEEALSNWPEKDIKVLSQSSPLLHCCFFSWKFSQQGSIGFYHWNF